MPATVLFALVCGLFQPERLSSPLPRVSAAKIKIFPALLSGLQTAAPLDASPAGLMGEYLRVRSFAKDGSLILVYGTAAICRVCSAAILQSLGPAPLDVESRRCVTDPFIGLDHASTEKAPMTSGFGD